MEQLNLSFGLAETRLTVAEGLALLWEHHLNGKPSGRSFYANRKALCRTIGHIYLNDLTKIHVTNMHVRARANGLLGKGIAGPQTIRHDLMLLTLLYNTLRDWKEEGYRIAGFNFATLHIPDRNPTLKIKRPKTHRREVLAARDQFLRFLQHASLRMKQRAYFAIDTGQQEIDLRKLRVTQYDSARDCLVFIRSKTGQRIVLPVTNREREVILEAKEEKREFVLEWTNHINEWRRLKIALGLTFQWRDLRKTTLNETFNQALGDIRPAQKIGGHASPRTTWDHYIVDNGQDLRPFLDQISQTFSEEGLMKKKIGFSKN